MQMKYFDHTLNRKKSICDTNKKVPYMGLLTLKTLIEVSGTGLMHPQTLHILHMHVHTPLEVRTGCAHGGSGNKNILST